MKKSLYVLIILSMIISMLPLPTLALQSDNKPMQNPMLVFAGNETYIYSVLSEDDGYTVAGTTKFDNGSTVFIQKIDKTGKALWNAYVGGQKDYVPAYVYPKVVKAGGYYYVIGSTQGSDVEGYHSGTCGNYPCSDILVAKVDKDGNIIWKKAYGTENGDVGYSAIVDGDGIIVVGYVNKNTSQKKYGTAYAMKIDENGSIIWQKKYTSDKAEALYDITKVGNTFVAVGMSYTNAKDIYILAIDGDGNELWHKYTNQKNWDEGFSITAVDDTHFVIGGYGAGFENFHSGSCGNYPCPDGYVAMYDINGNKVWGRSIGGTGEDKIFGVNFIDGNIYAVGYTKSSDGDFSGKYTPHNCGKTACLEGFIAILDSNGNIKETFVYDSSTRKGGFYDIKPTTFGYMVAGYNSDSKDDPDTGILLPFGKQAPEIPAVPTITDYPSTSSTPTVSIKGKADKLSKYVVISVNNTSTYTASVTNGTFQATLTLQEGDNHIKAKACNDSGCSEWSEPITITYQTGSEEQQIPSVPVLDPLPSTVYKPYITISGKTDKLAQKVEVFVNSELHTATVNNQRFSVAVSLYEGDNTIQARACNDTGCSEFTKPITVKYVSEIPVPTLNTPEQTLYYTSPDEINNVAITITGNTDIDGVLHIIANGTEYRTLNVKAGTFSFIYHPVHGQNIIQAKICVDEGICSDLSEPITITLKYRIVFKMWLGKNKYEKNGEPHNFSNPPFVIPPGRTVVPLRFIAEGFGFDVKWNGKERTITITGKDANNEDLQIILYMPYQPNKAFDAYGKKVYPGSSKVDIIKNGKKTTIDLTHFNGQNMGIPVIYNGRTYVPVRFISEIFGANVGWDAKEKAITITFER